MRAAIVAWSVTIVLGGCSLVVEDAGDTVDSETQQGSVTHTDEDPGSDGTNSSTNSEDTAQETGPTDATSPATDDTTVVTSPTTDDTDITTSDTGSTSSDEPVEVTAILINGGAEYTNTPVVQLTFEVKNAKQMRVYNEEQQPPPSAGWIQFKPLMMWQLAPMEGSRKVTAEFRNAVSGPVAASDNIDLDITPPQAPSVQRVGEYCTADTTPYFEWQSGGGDGAGIFRWKLDEDNLSVDAVETVSTTLEAPELFDGPHTLYVQERDRAGNWSDLGSALVWVDISGPDIMTFGFNEYPDGPLCQYTSQDSVALQIYALDYGCSDILDMQLRDQEMPWPSEWSEYSEVVDWQLPADYGTTIVEVSIRDALGNMNSKITSITRDDPYEGCFGNDMMSFPYDTEVILGDGFSGVVLKSGPAAIGQDHDNYLLHVPAEHGGFLSVHSSFGIDYLQFDVYRDGSFVGSGASGIVGVKEMWLPCVTGEDAYYVLNVRNISNAYQTYSVHYHDQNDACM